MASHTSTRSDFLALSFFAIIFALSLNSSVSAQSTSSPFSFPDRGGVSLTSSGASPTVSVGYSTLSSTGATPAGFAIFDLQEDGALVSETTVPEAEMVSQGRIYAEIGNGINTGLAIANPNAMAVSLAYYFTDTSGNHSSTGVMTVPAGGQIAQFLTAAPFDAPANFEGTFTFFILTTQPNLTVGAIALRGFTNERGEFLMTTLPVTPVGSRGLYSGDVLPHFASGAGWTTEVILVNPTDGEEDGTITFVNQAGQPAAVSTPTGTGSTFSYSIPAASAWALTTNNSGAVMVGSVQLATASVSADIPIGFLAFTYQSNGITVSSAVLPPSRPTEAARLFVETSGNFNAGSTGSYQTGIAISNADSTVPVQVTYDVTNLNGVSTGLTGSVTIPARGQVAGFVSQFPGMQNLGTTFQGVLRVAAPTPVTVTALRGRYNERGDFLLTTAPAVNENDPYFSLVLQYGNFMFPEFADGGGYMTQFVLFSGWTTGSTSGTLQFFSNTATPFLLTLH